jgi:hypothetical protein
MLGSLCREKSAPICAPMPASAVGIGGEQSGRSLGRLPVTTLAFHSRGSRVRGHRTVWCRTAIDALSNTASQLELTGPGWGKSLGQVDLCRNVTL